MAHTVDLSITALDTEFTPIVQPLSEAERRNLLGVGPAKETFIGDCLALVAAHPSLVPAVVPVADAIRDWATREQLLARRWAIAAILRKIDDTLAGLEGDCHATALEAYQVLVRGGTRLGVEPEVAQLRQHFARYGAKPAPENATGANANNQAAKIESLPAAASGEGSSASLAA